MSSKNKNSNNDLAKAIASYEMDRKEKGMSINKYYLLKMEELTQEFPDKPFGRFSLPVEQKTIKPKIKTVYAARPNDFNYGAQQSIRY